MNNTNPILSDESEKMKNRELLEEYFSCSLEIDTLLWLCPDDEDTIYQIVDLLVDTCATNRKLLHIAGDDKPAEVVRSRFMKLNADHTTYPRNDSCSITDDDEEMLEELTEELERFLDIIMIRMVMPGEGKAGRDYHPENHESREEPYL